MNRRPFALRHPAAVAAAWLLAGLCAAAPAAARSAFKLQTPTALPPTPQTWSFVAPANGDLAVLHALGRRVVMGSWLWIGLWLRPPSAWPM